MNNEKVLSDNKEGKLTVHANGNLISLVKEYKEEYTLIDMNKEEAEQLAEEISEDKVKELKADIREMENELEWLREAFYNGGA